MAATIVLTAHCGRLTETGRQLVMRLGESAPTQCFDIKDVLSVIEAVARFARDVETANPGASFEVTTRVVAGRKPRGFDAADKADSFGGPAFLRGDVDASALHRRLVDPSAAVAAVAE